MICMKKFLLKMLTGIMIMTFLFFCDNESVDAASFNKTLDENTRIMPYGVIVKKWGNIPKFKKGTVVTLNDYGEVLEGILAEDAYLPYETGISQDSTRPTAYAPMPFYIFTNTNSTPTERGLSFKGGTKVTFNDKGEVIKGTLSGSGQNIILNQTTYFQVSDGEVSFHKNGMIATCALANDSYLRPIGWSQILMENYTNNSACSGFIEFKGRKPMVINEKGEVAKGTLNKDTKLLSAVGIKVYEAGTTVEFDDKGIAVNERKVVNDI
jgi:hypothetical protein